MRTRYSIINMLVNIGGQFLTMLLSFIGRMVFIRCLSAAYLGVNGLFTDVLSILNFAELGIGTAMVFSMYEPAARDDEQKLARLMNLYKWMYRAVAASVLLFGLVLLPFLPYLIKGGEGIEHITLIYMMYVLSSACSYLLNYKSSIYQAYQKSYICTGWTLVCECIRTVVQIVALLLTGNFILYLAIQLVVQFIPNIIISHMADKEFPYLKECRELPEKEERHPEKHRRNEYAQAGHRHRAQHGQPADVLLHRSGNGGALLQLPVGTQRAEQPAEQVCHGFFRQRG